MTMCGIQMLDNRHDFVDLLIDKGNFMFRIDVMPEPKFPITRDAISQRFREICFRLNKYHMKGNGKLLGKQNMTDKFWMVVVPEGDGISHLPHFHALLSVPLESDTHQLSRTIKETWCKNRYTRNNSIHSFRYASDRDIEMDKGVRVVENPFIREEESHSQYPWEREYPPGSYAKFPLHIVPVEDAKGSLLYNMKDDRDSEKLFFVGLSEITNKT